MEYVGYLAAAFIGGFMVVGWNEWRQKRPIWARRAALKDIAALSKKLKELPNNENDEVMLEAEKRDVEVRNLDSRIDKAKRELGQ